jgi:hypothetical protein
MRLTEWITHPREENENLDILLQIVRLLRESGKGRGMISPALYDVDASNNVTFLDEIELPEEVSELYRAFKAPEGASLSAEDSVRGAAAAEKRDVFSLGLLLYYLLKREICYVNRQVSGFTGFFSKSRKKSIDTSAAMAEDSSAVPMLMQRMTSYEPDSRPYLKDVLCILQSNICKFGIIPQNVQTGERYGVITRSFTSSDSFKFVPESEFTAGIVTLAPVSCEPMLVPFRLVDKQYVLDVKYGSGGRWLNAEYKVDPGSIKMASHEEAAAVPKWSAALAFCNTVYLIKGDSLFIETDGFTYEMGFYEHDFLIPHNKKINIVRDGSIAVPERLEARVLSVLKEKDKTIFDLFCVAVYGSLNASVVKAINDMFPEAIRIYQLSEDDLLKGAAIHLNNSPKGGATHEV